MLGKTNDLGKISFVSGTSTNSKGSPPNKKISINLDPQYQMFNDFIIYEPSQTAINVIQTSVLKNNMTFKVEKNGK